MRYSNLLLGFLISIPVFSIAAPNDILIPSVIPQNQNFSAVDYFRDGRQSGCGLRITGETLDDLWLNVLITVFLKETGDTFGAIKIVARKVVMKDGKPLLRDGRISYLSVGNIQRAWIKPDSWELPAVYEGGGPSHNDAYMATVEFAGTMDLLVAISQGSFKVGVNRGGDKLEEIFQFEQRIGQDETSKLTRCMNNLRAEIEENKRKKSF
ncbi:MAG: hypothetical protein ABI479_11420 [Gallionella sp.]